MADERPNPAELTGNAESMFQSLIGEWTGTQKTWFEPNLLADESPIKGTFRRLPGSRYVIYEYQSSLDQQAFHGLAIFGFSTMKNRYESAWVDSFHMNTNIMLSEGNSTRRGFSVLGSYSVPGGGPAWGWRTEISLIDSNHIVVTAYNIMPEGQEAKALEANYSRVKPG